MNAFVDGIACHSRGWHEDVTQTRRGAGRRLVDWGMRRFARPPEGGRVLKVDAPENVMADDEQVGTVSHPNDYQGDRKVVAPYMTQWIDGRPANPELTRKGDTGRT